METITIKANKSFKTNNTQFDNQANYVAEQIKKHLIETAEVDEHFKKCLAKENKDFGECMIFVMNQAFKDPKQSSDDCCYQNARHYYLEDNIDKSDLEPIYTRNGSRMSNTSSNSKMSDNDLKKLKEEAVKEYKKSLEEEAKRKLEEKKAKEEAARKEKELAEQKKNENKLSLFDWND